MNFWQALLAFVIVFTCLLLVLVVLLQRGRGEGLSGAFGGGGGSGAFGAKTGDVFTWITVVVASVTLLLCVAANYIFDDSPRAVATAADTEAEGGETSAEPSVTGTVLPATPPQGLDPASAQNKATVTPIEPPPHLLEEFQRRQAQKEAEEGAASKPPAGEGSAPSKAEGQTEPPAQNPPDTDSQAADENAPEDESPNEDDSGR